MDDATKMTAETATGPVPSSQLGKTLMHEHIFINLMRESGRAGLLNDPVLMRSEINALREAGGSTLVELSTSPLTLDADPDPGGALSGAGARYQARDDGRETRTSANVLALIELSVLTGINIILGTGHYRDPYFDDGWVDLHSAEALAENLVRDIVEGFPGTDARAGIIGEIGSDKWYISAREERSFRAAALAQIRTGVALTTHAARWPVGLAQLDLLCSLGVDPQRIIIGHCGPIGFPEYHDAIAGRGAFVEFDGLDGQSDHYTRSTVNAILHLRSQGYLRQVLLSQDVCRTDQLASYGGNGYSFLFNRFVPLLLEAGLTDDDIELLLVVNPARALTG